MKRFAIIILLLIPFLGYGQEQAMFVHYIDMGQGLATLLQFPKGVVMIDAGSQIKSGGDESREKVKDYLRKFFAKNSQYKKTINTIIVTHNHQDHTGTIPDIYNEFKVKNIVTTEFHIGKDVNLPGIKKFFVTYPAILKKKPNGLTNAAIDPLKSYNGVDPKITVFSGLNPDFSSTSETPNNHSIVIRVQFGQASFIFTGDLETKGINYLLDKYKDHPNALNSDVYQVGHHGSPNATTLDLLNAMKPKIAIISASHKEDVSGGSGWDYGHPRDKVIDMLAGQISENRVNSIKGYVYSAQETTAYKKDVSKAIYCTCWDGTVVIRAASSGNYNILIDQ